MLNEDNAQSPSRDMELTRTPVLRKIRNNSVNNGLPVTVVRGENGYIAQQNGRTYIKETAEAAIAIVAEMLGVGEQVAIMPNNLVDMINQDAADKSRRLKMQAETIKSLSNDVDTLRRENSALTGANERLTKQVEKLQPKKKGK